jgi:hypothetical protein
MTPQEKDLTTILLDRLNKTEGQKDPEAEALIHPATAERHGAPYYLVQTVLIQDLSLHNAQRRITDLETQLTNRDKAQFICRSKLPRRSELPRRSVRRSEPSRDVPPNNVPPGGLGTGPPPIAAMQQPSSVPKPADARRIRSSEPSDLWA